MLGYAQKCGIAVAVLFLAAVCVITMAGRAEAAVRFVDPCWADRTLVPASFDYLTTAFGSLTAAIRAAAPGDRIVLNPGRYEEPVEQFPIVVDKAITICSAQGNAETIISGPPIKPVFEMKAPGVEIYGLTIEFKRYGMVVLADGVRICGNRLVLAAPAYRQTSCGIWLAGARKAQVTDNEFVDCGLSIAGPPVSDTSENLPVLTGLFEVGEDSDFFTTHRIERNLVNGKPLYYLVNAEGVNVPKDVGQVILAGCRDITLDGLDVSYASTGIELAYCQGVHVTNVTASGCGLFGVYLCYADACEIAGVTCNEDTHGLDLRAAQRNLVRNCNVTGCGQGIFLSWASDNLVTDCNVQGNGVGVFIASGERNEVASSRIIQNDLGLNVKNEQSLLLSENLISGNARTGVRLHNTGCTFYGNSLLENWVGLIATDSSEITISSNRFCANAQSGLYMMNLDRVKITRNQFTGNRNNDLEAAGRLTNALILQNSFTDPQGIILNDTANSVDLSLNWWGTTDSEQIAKRCRGAVKYAPFLTTVP